MRYAVAELPRPGRRRAAATAPQMQHAARAAQRRRRRGGRRSAPACARLRVGDRVMTCFFQDWPAGPPDRAGAAQQPGRSARRHAARARCVCPSRACARCPTRLGWDEAATLPCAAVTAWNALAVLSHDRPGGHRAGAGHRRRVAVRAAVRQADGRARDRHLAAATRSSSGCARSAPTTRSTTCARRSGARRRAS